MRVKKEIPTFIIEEHHEAFIVWNYAIQQGWIPATGNCLFHIDEHSDMSTPRFNESIHNLNGDIEKVKEFTYNELNIGSFVMPACYREIFDQIFWIRQKHRKTLHKSCKMYVRSYNKDGMRLMSGKCKNNKSVIHETDSKKFDYYLRIIDKIPSNKKVILDIDLDYFCCTGNPVELEEVYVEITKEEYNNFKNNIYHRLRFIGLGRINTLEKDGSFFYVFNYFKEIYHTKVNVDEDTINERIEHFVNILKEKKIDPILIDICRSRYSRYTPCEKWEYIENMLMDKLSHLYSIDKIDIYAHI